MTSGAASSAGPTLSRRHASGAESARGLLFTVLGEFVLPGGGAAWTSAVIEVLGRLGVEEKSARQALMRTAADGWLSSERVGRRTRWRLTGRAETLLTEGTERIYGFAGGPRCWDRQWLVLLVRVPESDRAARHQLRSRLGWAGFGAPMPGVWISPHTERRAEVRQVLAGTGLQEAHVFTARHIDGAPVAQMVGQAWDLDAVEHSYRGFTAEFRAGRRDPLTAVAELVHAWRRFPWIDPALPAELLPSGWSGTAAARLFARRHAQWSSAATAQWRELNSA